MFESKTFRLAGALVVLLLAFPTVDRVTAGPLNAVDASVLTLSASPDITEARYRRPVRRRAGVGPGAILGLFGAVLGGVIANQRYDNYSNYAYGQPSEYGYAPGYVAGPVNRGGGRAGGHLNRGGGGARGTAAWRGGGAAHAGKR